MTLDTGQNPKRFLPRLGEIVRPEEPQAAPTVLIHELPDGLLACRFRRVHATIIRARRTGSLRIQRVELLSVERWHALLAGGVPLVRAAAFVVLTGAWVEVVLNALP